MRNNREQEFQEVILNGFFVGLGLIVFYLTFVSPVIHEIIGK